MKLGTIVRFFGGSAAAFLLAGGASAAVDLQPYFTHATGSHPEAVAIGDFNNDGRNDVLLNTSFYFDPENDYKLKVYLQDEYGQLQPAVNYSISAEYTSPPQTIAAGDLNGDGLLDVAVGMDRSHIEIFLQYTDGSLFSADTIETPLSTRIAVADLNGDGLDDIAGIGWGGDDVGVFYQGEMGISHSAELHRAPHGGYDDLALGDVNGDGANDIVVMSGQSYARDNLAVVASDGQGGFLPVAFYDLGGDQLTQGVTIGDINSDGLNDVTVTFGGNQPRSSIAVFHQGQDGLLQYPLILPSYEVPESILAADMDRNGTDDLLVLHGGWDTLGLYEQSGSGKLENEALFPISYASHYNPQGLDAGDINSDGVPDVVVADYNNGLVVLLGVDVASNEVPVANAGIDQEVTSSSLVALDGSRSTDSDGEIVNYRWSQTYGPEVNLNSSGNGLATFVAPVVGSGERVILTFELQVEDDGGLTAADQVNVVVDGGEPPIADAGATQHVKAGTQVLLDGSGSSDSDGTIVGYRWSQVSGTPVELSTFPDGTAEFVARVFGGPLEVIEILEFELVVEDDSGLRGTSRVFIYVEGLRAPVAEAHASETTVDVGTAVFLDGSQSSDSDGSIVSYRWSQIGGPSAEIASSPDGSARFVAPTIPAGTKVLLQFELEVEDNDGLTAKAAVAVMVERNMPPVVVLAGEQTVTRNSPVELDASASTDIDGSISSFQWAQLSGPAVSLVNANTAVASFTAPKARGNEEVQLVFELTVTDDKGESSTGRVTVTVVK